MYCEQCNLGNQTGAFCKSCGKFLDPAVTAPNEMEKSKSVDTGTDVENHDNAQVGEPATPEEDSTQAELETPAVDLNQSEQSAEIKLPEQNTLPEESEKPVPPVTTPRNIFNLWPTIQLLWTYTGTTSRKNYTWFLVFSVVWGFLLNGIRDFELLNAVLAMLYLIFASSVLTRRLRETGFKMQWFLILLVPLLGPLTFLTFVSFPAKPQTSSNPVLLQLLVIIGISLLGWLAFLVLVPGVTRAFS